MGIYPHGRKVVLFGKPRNVYLLDDEFRDTLAAGSVNGIPVSATYAQIPIYDYVCVRLEHADVGDSVSVWFMME